MNLREIADQQGIKVHHKGGRVNRHWVTDSLESILGLPRKSLRDDVWAGDKIDPQFKASVLKLVEQDANPENYRIVVGWSTLEQQYVALIPELRKWGVACGGRTPENAISNLRAMRDGVLEQLRASDTPVPRPIYVRIPG